MMPISLDGRILSVEEMIAHFKSKGMMFWTQAAEELQREAHSKFATIDEWRAAKAGK